MRRGRFPHFRRASRPGPVPAAAPPPAAPPAPAPEPEPTALAPAWSPSMSKTKLLEVAASRGLDVSTDSTKAEIVDALFASDQAASG